MESIFLDYEISLSSRSRFLIILGGILFFFFLIFGLIWWLFSRPISLPSHTTFLLTVRPKTAVRVLSTEAVSSLPEPWQTSLQTRSSWPIVLGAKVENGVWQTFALTPRWVKPSSTYPKSAHGLIAYHGHPITGSSTTTSYDRFYRSWITTFRSSAVGEIDLTSLLDNDSQVSSTSVAFAVSKNQIRTNLSFEKMSKNYPPLALHSNDDVSLDFDRLQTTPFVFSLLHSLRWGDRNLSQLSVLPNQIHVSLDQETSDIERIRLTFNQTLSPMQKQDLLSNARIVDKRVIRLPDGSLAVEHHYPSLNETSSDTFISPFGTIFFQENRAELFSPSTTSTEVDTLSISLCAPGAVIARLSPTAFAQFGKTLSLTLPPKFRSSGIQFTENKNRLNICIE